MVGIGLAGTGERPIGGLAVRRIQGMAGDAVIDDGEA